MRAYRAGFIAVLGLVGACGTNSGGSSPANSSVTNVVAAAVTPAAVVPAPIPAQAIVAVTVAAANGLDGESPIADNFDFTTGIQPTDWGTPETGNTGGLPPVSADAGGAFRMLCFAGQLLKDDPLVMPGQPGAAHLHQFWGNTGANANSNYQSLRTTGQSTCQNSAAGPLNRTAYWLPAMLDGVGHAVKPDLIQTYYKNNTITDPDCTIRATACLPLPNGIRYTFGYNMKTNLDGITDPNSTNYWMTKYSCWKDDIGTKAIEGTFRTIDDVVSAGCPVGAKLIIEFVAPNCWDGKNVDSADHRSHIAFATRWTSLGYGCPLDHPYLIPNWSGHIHYTTDDNFVAGKWRLSSDDMASQMAGHTVPAGSTLHFDYWEAWSPVAKALWQKNCIDGHKSANRGDLCNGTMMKLWPDGYPTHQLVAI